MEDKRKEITALEDKMRLRHNHLATVKVELESKRKEMKEIQELLELTKKRAERAERMVEELKKEKAQTHVAPPVANIEKPGPDGKVEEDESEDQTVDTTMLQTTGGGIYGDTEGDDNETFTVPDPPPTPPPPPEGEKESRPKGEER